MRIRMMGLLVCGGASLLAGCMSWDEEASEERTESTVEALPNNGGGGGLGLCMIYTPYDNDGSWGGWGWRGGTQSGSSCYGGGGRDRVNCAEDHAICLD
jgi:hypothetical protein